MTTIKCYKTNKARDVKNKYKTIYYIVFWKMIINIGKNIN